MLSTEQFKKDTSSALYNPQLRINFKRAMSGLMKKRLAVFPDDMVPEFDDYIDPIEESKDLLFEIDAVITSTRGGIAEIGSLILWPTPEEPRLMSLVPPLHIAVLYAVDL